MCALGRNGLICGLEQAACITCAGCKSGKHLLAGDQPRVRRERAQLTCWAGGKLRLVRRYNHVRRRNLRRQRLCAVWQATCEGRRAMLREHIKGVVEGGGVCVEGYVWVWVWVWVGVGVSVGVGLGGG